MQDSRSVWEPVMCFPAVESCPWRPAGWHRCLWALGADAAELLEHRLHFVSKLQRQIFGMICLFFVFCFFCKKKKKGYTMTNISLISEVIQLMILTIYFGVQRFSRGEWSAGWRGYSGWQRGDHLIEVWCRRGRHISISLLILQQVMLFQDHRFQWHCNEVCIWRKLLSLSDLNVTPTHETAVWNILCY